MRRMLNKKRIIALVLIAAMAMASAATVFADTVVTTTIATPLYKYATVADGEYGTVPQGTALTVISNNGVFYYVLYGGNYGYILQSACNGSGTGTGTGTNVSYYVTTNAVANLYYSANTTGGTYGTIQSGQSLGVISSTNGFYYVYYSGRYGYVLMSSCNSTAGSTTGNGTATVTYATPFYTSASTSGGYYGTFDSGDIVNTYSTSGSFTYIYFSGKYGYVLTTALRTNTNNGTSFYATTTAAAPLYSSASTSASTYTTIPSGTTVSVTSTTGSFYYLLYNGYYGYVPTNYFNNNSTNGNYTFYVTTNSSAGLYSSASTSSSIYTTIASGTSIGVISTSGSFYYTLYNGYYGYVLTSACNGGTGTSANTSVQYYLSTLYSTPLYSSTNTSSVSYSTISAGTSVGVISKTYDGFYYVYINGNYGYIPQAALNSTGSTSITPNNSGIATYGTVAMGSTLYSTDSTTGTALGRVSNSGTVSIISQTTTGFYYVKVGNYTGYLQIAAVTVANDATVIPITDDRSYVPTTIPLVNTSATNTGVTTKKSGTVENCVSWVSLREEANSTSDRLAKVTKGSTVTILGNEGSYTKVTYAGTTGYILSSYIA